MAGCPLCRIPGFLLKPGEAFQEVRNETLSSAAGTVIPLVVLFIFSMKLFIKGMTEGAVKG